MAMARASSASGGRIRSAAGAVQVRGTLHSPGARARFLGGIRLQRMSLERSQNLLRLLVLCHRPPFCLCIVLAHGAIGLAAVVPVASATAVRLSKSVDTPLCQICVDRCSVVWGLWQSTGWQGVAWQHFKLRKTPAKRLAANVAL
ncbi:unnamed protein product [Symbiodinium necroappetens]|uniref:Uncharacterized protein n=1 Tax=Symbiodinium necroappetens TaxID=1628268 RepID=A0A812ZQE0_9DINO|nr:unnamed protein product [Symbiodinium necroappetens]